MMAGNASHRLGVVLGVGPPDQSAGIDLVSEDEVDAVLGPELSCGARYPFIVESPGDVQHPRSGLGHVEDALDDAGGVGVGFQRGAFLCAVLHHDPVEAVGRPAGDPEAAGGGLAHPPGDLLGQDIGYPIDTKNCGTRGGWAWRLLKVTAPRLLASDVPTAAPRATLSLDVNVARAGDDYDSGDVQ